MTNLENIHECLERLQNAFKKENSIRKENNPKAALFQFLIIFGKEQVPTF